MYDILFINGEIYDGSGKAPIKGNVAVSGDRIVYPPEGIKGKNVINLEGSAISPGFINIHSHSDMALIVDGSGPSCILQGITTEVTGNCGYSLAPLSGDTLEEIKKEFKKVYDMEVTWRDFEGFFQVLEEGGISPNVISLAGHGTLRGSVMGMEDRKPSGEELKRMKKELRKAMKQGAAGLSTGLIYPPGCYAETEELIELSKVVKEYNGFYSTHMRNEGDYLIEAIKEAIKIGREGKVPIEISHLKAAGEKNKGKTKEALEIIKEAREEGLFIHHDQYPYTASSTGLSMMVPQWAQAGGREAFMSRLRDEKTMKAIKKDMEKGAYKNGKKVLVSYVNLEKNKKYEGRFLKEIADEEEKEIFDFILKLLLEEEGGVGAIYMSMDEEDVKRVMNNPFTVIGTDGSAYSIKGPLHKGKPHPRSYGTFPRVLGHYCRNLKLFPIEEAIRKMTSLPAKILGLKSRGLIKNNFFADLVVFSPKTIEDTATYKEPHSYPEGIEYVMVNGKMVVSRGEILPERPGRVIRNLC